MEVCALVAANDRTELDRLMAARMVHTDGNDAPTVTGLLVIGRNPRWHIGGAYVQFLRIDGTDLADPIVDAQVIDGRVEQMYRQTMVKLRAFRTVAYDILPEVGERQTPSVPLVALEQMLANALMHRSYEGTNSPVRITWFNDRIEFMNSGGPYGDVTAEKFGQPGLADYRNPDLAESMRVLGIVQRFGVGIRLAQNAMQEAVLPPITWETSSTYVRAIVPVRR